MDHKTNQQVTLNLFLEYLRRSSEEIVREWADRMMAFPGIRRLEKTVPRETHETGMRRLLALVLARIEDPEASGSFEFLREATTEGYLSWFDVGDVILQQVSLRQVIRQRFGGDPSSAPFLEQFERQIDQNMVYIAESYHRAALKRWKEKETEAGAAYKELRSANEELSRTNEEIRQTAEELRCMTEKYRAFIENASDAIFIMDTQNFNFLEANRKMEELTGYAEDELLRRSLVSTVPPEDLPPVMKVFEEVIRLGEPRRTELRVRHKDGTLRDVDLHVGVVDLDRTQVLHAIARGVGARPARDGQAGLARDLLEGAPVGVLAAERNGRIRVFNRRMEDLTGWRAAEVRDLDDWEEKAFPNPALREGARRLREEVLEGAIEGIGRDLAVSCKDGSLRTLRVTGAPVRNVDGGIGAAVFVASEAQAAGVEPGSGTRLDEFPCGVYATSPEGRLLDLNAAFAEMLGRSREEMLDTDVAILYADPRQRSQYVEALERKGLVSSFHVELRRRDGSALHALDTGRAVRDAEGRTVRYEGVVVDVTHKTELDRRIAQRRLMESLGRIAGGIAHDFNNYLTSVLGYASLMKNNMDETDANFKRVAIVESAALQAADLSQQLLFLGRKTRYDLKPIDPSETIVETIKVLRRILASHDVEILTELDPEVGAIEADSNQIQRALMNLGKNAGDALPPEGGRITFATSRKRLAQGEIAGLPQGDYVVLSVRDNGSGIPPEIRDRIFEPYVTTKEMTKGTGLGLATVYKIVQDHGGAIEAGVPPDGVGAMFHIYLPAAGPLTPREEPKASPRIEGGKETILIAEDNEMNRDMVKEILERYGYTVLTAVNGKEALSLFKEQVHDVQLVFLDLDMPEMDGLSAYEEMRRLNPNLRVILTTGYGRKGKVQEALANGEIDFLQKPYRHEDLLIRIREVLDAKRPQKLGSDSGA